MLRMLDRYWLNTTTEFENLDARNLILHHEFETLDAHIELSIIDLKRMVPAIE